ncbi:MAG: sugar ABC transporter permease [Eubacteriales bacterium]
MNKKKLTTKRLYPMKLTLPALIIYSIFIIIPFMASIGLSFSDWNISRMYQLEFRGLDNYISIFKDDIFFTALKNTLLFAAGTTVLKICAGMLLALLLLKTSRLNSVLRTIFYMPCVLSPLVIGVLFKSILAYDGLINNFLTAIGLESLTSNWLGAYSTAMTSIIMVESWMWSGFTMFLFIAGMQAISKDYYEYADTEGVSTFNQFRYITIPLLVPSFTVVMTLSLTGGLKVFDIIYVLTGGGPGYDTQVMSTYVQRAFTTGLLGQACAATVLLSVLIVTISFTVNRFLSKREVEM